MKKFLCIQMSRHIRESLLEVSIHQSVAEKAAASSSVRYLALTKHQVTKNH
jgi:hypothetical protein